MRRLWALCLLAWPLAGAAAWQTVEETANGVRMVDVARAETVRGQVRFAERTVLRAGQIDPATLRSLREILEKRVLDCATRRAATLSRAVFADHDALIEHRVVRQDRADWKPLAADDPRVRLLCPQR